MGSGPHRLSTPALHAHDRALRRRRLLAATAAITSAGLVWFGLAGARSAGPDRTTTRPIVVVAEAVAAGAPIGPHLETVDWPVDLVPDGTFTDPGELADRHAIVPVPAGSPLTTALVTDDPAVRRDEIAVRIDPHTPALDEGDVIDVWATFDPSLAGGGATTRRIARDVTVVSVDEETTMIAVEPDDTPTVVEATVLATITLVRSRR